MRPTTALKTVPLIASMALVVTACGNSADGEQAIQQAVPAEEAATGSAAPPARHDTSPTGKVADRGPTREKQTAATPRGAQKAARTSATVRKSDTAASTRSAPAAPAAKAAPAITADQAVYDQRQGATDVGVTKDSIRLGSVNMHGMALANVITAPQARGNLATIAAINDRGGVLGRRLTITDCDDGPGEVSRAKSCIKKLVGQDKIFSLITGVDWATASIHDDLKQYKLPYVGAWAYSQTEWQDPYMFPTHMSMIHEAMSGAHWTRNVIKPRTYGLICLTSPEMQLACSAVQKIMDSSGARLVKKFDVSISETSMSGGVLAMRSANPDHIIHYVINPATMVKFMVEAAQQGYYPPKGISGNHLASEVLGSLFGQWPAGRYWTNTTYRLWGAEFISTISKYARGNRGQNHHIVQAGYVAVNIFSQAAKKVGPNLTRERLMAQLANGTVWRSDASLDQRFAYVASERHGEHWSPDNGQGREFMYKYASTNTASNPDGSPSGFEPDPDQFVIHTFK